MVVTSIAGAMRFTRPFSTAPEPSSYALVTPSFAIAWIDSPSVRAP